MKKKCPSDALRRTMNKKRNIKVKHEWQESLFIA